MSLGISHKATLKQLTTSMVQRPFLRKGARPAVSMVVLKSLLPTFSTWLANRILSRFTGFTTHLGSFNFSALKGAIEIKDFKLFRGEEIAFSLDRLVVDLSWRLVLKGAAAADIV